MTLPAPGSDVVFRPEEQHRGSGEADVAPPVASGNRKVNDTRSGDERPVDDGDDQRLAGHGTGGGHRAVDAEQRQDGKAVPDAVAPPLASPRAHEERGWNSGERLGHPNVRAAGNEDERVVLRLETVQCPLDVIGGEAEVRGDLDRAGRAASVGEVLIDPQTDP